MKALILKGGDKAVPWHESARTGGSRAPGGVAVSGDGRQWAMINLSPAVADQLATDARLLAHGSLCLPAARAVVLTDTQVDHVAGLMGLRDGPPIHLYVTPAVYEELSHSLPVLPLLQHYCGVHWHVIPVAGECTTAEFHVDGLPNLVFTAIATQAPLPPHVQAHGGRVVGDAIAVAVHDRLTGQRLFCAPGLRGIGPQALAWMEAADCVLIGEALASSLSDVPLYVDASTADDAAPAEMPDAASRRRRAREVRSEAVDVLAAVPARRKVLLRAGGGAWAEGLPGDESPWWAERGIEVAADRQQIEL